MELDFRRDPGILSMVVDNMAVGVFTVDASGTFVAWSEGAERITGYPSAEVIGKPCHILEGPNCKGFRTLAELLEDPTSPCITDRCFQPGCSDKAELLEDPAPCICNQECKVLAKDGRELYLHGSVRVLTDEQGKKAGAVGTFTDLTSFFLANEKIAILEEQAKSRSAFERLVGKSAPMQEVFRRLRLAAQSDVTVLLTGESGTGKELAARAIHSLSARKERPFIGVNCSAIPETLLESELFGHVKGAFTGAVRDKAGIFQAAEGGTLFLDEIGDISSLLQLKLLRVLQEREIRRVGDHRPIKANVRLITATNKDLGSLLASGALREDFYYRIRVFEIVLPPLRERREDIPLMVEHFVADFRASQGKPVQGITRDALQGMMAYPWPGNVRELRNAIEHGFVTVEGDHITLLDLPLEIRNPRVRPAKARTELHLTTQDLSERLRIQEALRRSEGNRTEAAKSLGISRVTLWKKIQRLGIAAGEIKLPPLPPPS